MGEAGRGRAEGGGDGRTYRTDKQVCSFLFSLAD